MKDGTHYHIRWAGGKLDWQAFQTEEEAKADAERLKGPDEKYVIEAQDGACVRCIETRGKRDASKPSASA